MCLFAAIFGVHPDIPLLVLANRDELRNRPTGAPRIVSEPSTNCAWLGGMDLEAGGTWLGVNSDGLLVAMTNRRKRKAILNRRSRGLLCRDLLRCSSVDEAEQQLQIQLSRHEFDGFNCLTLSWDAGVVTECTDDVRQTRLGSGIHVIANGTLNDAADQRVAWARREVERIASVDMSLDQSVAELQRISALHHADVLNSICRVGFDRGTVSSTIVALTTDVTNARYLYAPGPPAETTFDDYSSELRRLLSGVAK